MKRCPSKSDGSVSGLFTRVEMGHLFLGLVAALLWYLNSYVQTKGSLEVACGFITREAQNKIRDASGIMPGDLEDANRVCSKEHALP